MINSSLVNFTKSETYYHLHFCHACLNMLLSELDVAQCSSFVKLLEWIPAMFFVVMFEYCSIFNLMHLDGYLLIIADQCHISFACHFQTVHPIPMIFILISTESSHVSSGTLGFPSWFLVHPFPSGARICIAYRIPHVMPCFASCCLRIAPWLIVVP